MLSKQINITPEVLDEIREDLQPVPDKSVFLNMLISKRLAVIKDIEMIKFSNKLDQIEKKVDAPTCDLKELSSLVRELSKVSHSMCKSQLHLFEVLNKLSTRKTNKNRYYYPNSTQNRF